MVEGINDEYCWIHASPNGGWTCEICRDVGKNERMRDYHCILNTDTNIPQEAQKRLEEIKHLSSEQLLDEKAYYERHEALHDVDDSRYQAILAELRTR